MRGAHLVLTPRASADQPPRIVLIKFLRSSAREKVLQVAREKGITDWEGCRISFFPDMSRELARKRREFTALRRMLRNVNVKYTLAYPASLRFTWQGKSKVFTSSADAEQFIKEHCGATERRDQIFFARSPKWSIWVRCGEWAGESDNCAVSEQF